MQSARRPGRGAGRCVRRASATEVEGLDHTPVHDERRAVDVRRRRRGEEGDGPRDFVRLPPPANRRAAVDLVGEAAVALERGRQVRLDVAGPHHVDRDALAAELGREAARQALDPGLGRVVPGQSHPADVRHDRAHVDDAAPAPLPHAPGALAREHKRADQIRAQHVLKLGRRKLVERVATVEPGVVDENVDSAVLRDECGHRGDALHLVADVERDCRTRGSRVPLEQAPACVLHGGRVGAGEDRVRSLRRQRLGDGEADAS
mmetsp:Transcript_10125/g.32502  ORF Transcript_10125/g.32502 Transcript_10125/m.32502 type:complete len:262 (-) Transcript_10125:45-830(-)